MANTFAKYSEIFFDSSICNFSKLPRSFCRYTFLTLSAYWFASCKTSDHAYLYVDDLIFTGNNPKIFWDFKQAMIKEFEMMNIGLISYYLRIEIK
jgi:hypothetical protein